MAQTHAGALKVAAQKAGLSLAEYEHRRRSGEKWCTRCKAWHPIERFGRDATRYDGLAAACAAGRNRFARETYEPVPADQRLPYGPPPAPARDDDRRQARQRVNLHVRMGRMPHPNAVPCHDCGHEWAEGERRHEYDHFAGYSADAHEKIQAVCTTCHANREMGRRTHCLHGHPFDEQNTFWTKGGTRVCLTCRRSREREKRTAAWWRERRARHAQRQAAAVSP